MIKIANQEIVPDVTTLAHMVQALRLQLDDNIDEESRKIISELPSKKQILGYSSSECAVIYEILRYLWKKLGGININQDQKFENHFEHLSGSFWILKNGLMIGGENHFTIIKRNLDLFSTLLNIGSFEMHSALSSSNPDTIIKMVIDGGAIRALFKEKIGYFQVNDRVYGEWGINKIRKFELKEKFINVLNKKSSYDGWKSGILIKN